MYHEITRAELESLIKVLERAVRACPGESWRHSLLERAYATRDRIPGEASRVQTSMRAEPALRR